MLPDFVEYIFKITSWWLGERKINKLYNIKKTSVIKETRHYHIQMIKVFSCVVLNILIWLQSEKTPRNLGLEQIFIA